MAVNVSAKSKFLAKIEAFKPLIFPTIYLILTITLAISIFSSFSKRNYISIYIEGSSMQPTLNNNAKIDPQTGYIHNTEYGYADKSALAINNIERFNIIVTYYQSDYDGTTLKPNSDFKIKRVIAFPGETFSIKESVLNIKDSLGNLTYTYDFKSMEKFKINRNQSLNQKDHAEYTLAENEYWVLGDNWNVSHDSQTAGPILSNYISGVLVAIEGTCTLTTIINKEGKRINKFIDYKKYDKPIYFL